MGATRVYAKEYQIFICECLLNHNKIDPSISKADGYW